MKAPTQYVALNCSSDGVRIGKNLRRSIKRLKIGID